MMDEENKDQEINSQEPDFSDILNEIGEGANNDDYFLQNQEQAENGVFEEDIIENNQADAENHENVFPSVAQDDADFEQETQEEELITVRPVKFQEFKETPPIRSIKKNLDILQDVHMHISVELGRTKSSIREVIEMEEGSVVELEKIAGEQVEVYVNEKLVAKGEVIVIEDKFGVRITSTSLPKNLD